jgi:predicted DNA-binding transcriptional regulator AlpA
MKFLRFADLKTAGIINSWPMLRRRIERDGFPAGRMLGPNTRAWTEDEILAWLDGRPTARKAGPRGGRPRKAAGETLTA